MELKGAVRGAVGRCAWLIGNARARERGVRELD